MTSQVKGSTIKIERISEDMFITLTAEPNGYRHTLVECKLHFKTEKDANAFIKEMVKRYNLY